MTTALLLGLAASWVGSRMGYLVAWLMYPTRVRTYEATVADAEELAQEQRLDLAAYYHRSAAKQAAAIGGDPWITLAEGHKQTALRLEHLAGGMPKEKQ